MDAFKRLEPQDGRSMRKHILSVELSDSDFMQRWDE
jgi:hypothetical protein